MKKNNYGIKSLVLGIVSILFCWIPIIGLIPGVLGIIFYFKQKKISSNNIVLAGLITSIIGLTFGIVCILFCLFIAGVIHTVGLYP